MSLADRVQQQTGVPYVLLDGSLSAIPRAYEALGSMLDLPGPANDLARWTERLLRDVDRRVAAIPEGRRPSVYYARGPRGLETGLRGSINVESLERIGARNVAADRPAQSGIATVSKEQILGWDPEVIVTIDAAFMETVRADSRWRGVRAVRDGRVYRAPLLPFPWIDFPPSVNRLIGLAWLEIVVLRVRGPRILAAVTIGAALAAPGTAYQGLFRNPLVSPDILGVASGAALGAVIGIYLSLSVVAGQTLAFAVGLGAIGAVCASGAALRRHDHVLVLVLGGIVGA